MKNKFARLAFASLFCCAVGYCGRLDYTAYNTRICTATVLSGTDIKCQDGNIYGVDDVGFASGDSVIVYFDTMGTHNKTDDVIIKIKKERK